MTIVTLTLSSLSALCFMMLWYVWTRRTARQELCPVSFEVMERSNKRTTLRNPSRVKWYAGLFYSGFFYFGLPFFIWRYGIYRALGLIVATAATCFGLPFLAGLVFNLSGETSRAGIFIVASVFLRAAVGVYVALNDIRFRRETLVNRGWTSLGSCTAKSKKEALRCF